MYNLTTDEIQLLSYFSKLNKRNKGKMLESCIYTGDYYAKSFTKYMNNESGDAWTSVYGSVCDMSDISLYIEYEDGSNYYYCGGDSEGVFKQIKIKYAIYIDGYQYIVFNYDMKEEFENWYEEEYMYMLEEQQFNELAETKPEQFENAFIPPSNLTPNTQR